MRYLFELSKEHDKLPKNEVFSTLKAEDISYKLIEENLDLIIIKTSSKQKDIKNFANRLSYTFNIDQLLFISNLNQAEIKKYAIENKIKQDGSLVVRYRNRSESIDSQIIVKLLAEIYTKNRTVSLNNPDIELRAFITNNKLYVGVKVFQLDKTQFEKRKVQYRPFFSPISLHPKLARALVNLSCVKKNQVLLDPFCGTGGILLEAGLMGIKTIGNDIEEKMVSGCKQTLDHFRIKNYNIYNMDISAISQYVDSVDAVVTDFPYGKSTTTKGEKIEQLYNRSFQVISKVLKKNCKAVIGFSDKQYNKIGKRYLTLIKEYEYRVHSSLTRNFSVFQK